MEKKIKQAFDEYRETLGDLIQCVAEEANKGLAEKYDKLLKKNESDLSRFHRTITDLMRDIKKEEGNGQLPLIYPFAAQVMHYHGGWIHMVRKQQRLNKTGVKKDRDVPSRQIQIILKHIQLLTRALSNVGLNALSQYTNRVLPATLDDKMAFFRAINGIDNVFNAKRFGHSSHKRIQYIIDMVKLDYMNYLSDMRRENRYVPLQQGDNRSDA